MRSERAKREDDAVTAERLGYRPGLDGLRGVAVLLVLLGHADFLLVKGGRSGVILFFVLSGFLITTLLLEERERTGTVALVSFYLRRARRLFPALVVVLAVAALWLPVSEVVPVALYYGNWVQAFDGDGLGFLSHTWSLAIEEQFYLAWPLVMLLVPQHAKRVAVVGVGVAVGLRFGAWHDTGDSQFLYFATFARIDAILAGCLLALSSWRPRNLLLPLTGVAGLALVTSEAFTYRVGFALVALFSVLAVSAAAQREAGWLTHPVLVWFGRRSYGIYLWHGIIVFGLHPDRWYEHTAAVSASLLLAEISWRLVERRWVVRRASTTPQRSLIPAAA